MFTLSVTQNSFVQSFNSGWFCNSAALQFYHVLVGSCFVISADALNASVEYRFVLQLIRPPGTLVPKALRFTRDVFFFRRATSELPQLIAVKLCHVIAISVNFIMQVQKFGGQRNWGPKTCKIRRDFRQLQTSITNFSRTGQDIQNRKAYWSRAIPLAFDERSPTNFGPLTTENWMWVWTPK